MVWQTSLSQSHYGHTTIKATAYYYNLVPLFADQLNELSGSGLTEILPDLTDYYTNEEE